MGSKHEITYVAAPGAVAQVHAKLAAEEAARRARRAPLAERVAEAMREIAAVRGSCDRDDLVLRFPDEELSDTVIARARARAGRLARVA